MKTIDKIRAYISKARKEIMPEITDEMLDDDGAIYYLNGNNGTDFNWKVNGRTCEFGVFHKGNFYVENLERSQYLFLKVYVTNNNEIKGYMYSENIFDSPCEELPVVKLEEGEASSFAAELYSIADAEFIYDEKISHLSFWED